jgi:ribosome-associated toxin RatA of RatAB toxin-antitoxin module
MRYETSRTTTAEPSRLWAVVSDVERWPEWIEVYE